MCQNHTNKMSMNSLDRVKIKRNDRSSVLVPFDIPKSPILMMFWVVRKMFCALSGGIDPDRVFYNIFGLVYVKMLHLKCL